MQASRSFRESDEEANTSMPMPSDGSTVLSPKKIKVDSLRSPSMLIDDDAEEDTSTKIAKPKRSKSSTRRGKKAASSMASSKSLDTPNEEEAPNEEDSDAITNMLRAREPSMAWLDGSQHGGSHARAQLFPSQEAARISPYDNQADAKDHERESAERSVSSKMFHGQAIKANVYNLCILFLYFWDDENPKPEISKHHIVLSCLGVILAVFMQLAIPAVLIHQWTIETGDPSRWRSTFEAIALQAAFPMIINGQTSQTEEDVGRGFLKAGQMMIGLYIILMVFKDDWFCDLSPISRFLFWFPVKNGSIAIRTIQFLILIAHSLTSSFLLLVTLNLIIRAQSITDVVLSGVAMMFILNVDELLSPFDKIKELVKVIQKDRCRHISQDPKSIPSVNPYSAYSLVAGCVWWLLFLYFCYRVCITKPGVQVSSNSGEVKMGL